MTPFFYSAHTFEHVQDEHLCYIYKEIYRCLKPQGAIRIQVPNFDLVYDAMKAGDIQEVMNLSYSSAAERFHGMAVVYGEEHARKILTGWPETNTPPEGPWRDEEVCAIFLGFFAGHQKEKCVLSDVQKDIQEMSKKAFAEKYIDNIDMHWKRQNPQQHTNWLNPEKLVAGLRAAGFEEVNVSEPFNSRYEEMRGVGKYWGFDHRLPHSSCYVEAQK